jgi:hypothetical protein
MGCAASNPVAPAHEGEKKRIGVPGRIEIPNTRGGFKTGTIHADLSVERAFRIRIDNLGAPPGAAQPAA